MVLGPPSGCPGAASQGNTCPGRGSPGLPPELAILPSSALPPPKLYLFIYLSSLIQSAPCLLVYFYCNSQSLCPGWGTSQDIPPALPLLSVINQKSLAVAPARGMLPRKRAALGAAPWPPRLSAAAGLAVSH